MMKRHFSLMAVLLCVACSVAVYAGNKKNLVEEHRSTAAFERITLQGSPTIVYEQGSKCAIRVKAPADVIGRVQTRVQNGRLTVSLKDGSARFFSINSRSNNPVTVYVTSPDLIEVEVLGSGDFKSAKQVDTDNMRIQLKGSGDVDFADIICDRISTSLVGSGDVDIDKLTAQRSTVELVGSGDVKIKQYSVKQTTLQLKGSGDIEMQLNRCGSVDCKLIGSGDITLKGTVRSLTQSAKGSGDVKTKGLSIQK